MPRMMSFSASVDAIRQRRKTVTRRTSWNCLKPGDTFWAIAKHDMRPGAKVDRLALLRCVSVRRERLDAITSDDVAREGFADWSPADFVRFFCETYGAEPSTVLTRIEFSYEDEAPFFTAPAAAGPVSR